MNLLAAIGLFFLAIITDVVWARYTLAVGNHFPFAAAWWAACIVVCGCIDVDAYLHSRWYAVPLAVGSALGTFVAVFHAKRTK